jgi:hypothetical protein
MAKARINKTIAATNDKQPRDAKAAVLGEVKRLGRRMQVVFPHLTSRTGWEQAAAREREFREAERKIDRYCAIRDNFATPPWTREPPPTSRTKPVMFQKKGQRERALNAIHELYPDGVPAGVSVETVRWRVAGHLKSRATGLKDPCWTTIARALGRR